MTYRDIAREQLVIDEGCRRKPYVDTVGKTSIGVGRNLTDKGLRDDEIALMFANDMDDAEFDARMLVPSFDSLSEPQKAVLLNLAFNLGRSRLAGFRKFLAAIEAKDFERAAVEMLDSKWAAQVGARAKRLAKQIRIV